MHQQTFPEAIVGLLREHLGCPNLRIDTNLRRISKIDLCAYRRLRLKGTRGEEDRGYYSSDLEEPVDGAVEERVAHVDGELHLRGGEGAHQHASRHLRTLARGFRGERERERVCVRERELQGSYCSYYTMERDRNEGLVNGAETRTSVRWCAKMTT